MRVLAAFLVNALFNFAIGLMVAKFLGPEQFGRFALALAIGTLVQTIAFEWIRLSAIRFYSERSRTVTPALRATLDFAFGVCAFALVAGMTALILAGVEIPPSQTLVALGVAAAVGNGAFDYHAALLRARFLDRAYGRLVLAKNLIALVLTVGAAWYSGSAVLALTGASVSLGSSVFFAQRSLADKQSPLKLADRMLAYQCARYGAPIIAANALYVMIPFINRALVTSHFGFAETGRFALAYDIGLRIIAAVGAALDVLLFQIAVRTEEMQGRGAAQAQVARNAAVIFALLLPLVAGLWLILPSLEAIIVPAEFRGAFANYMSLMIPGILAFGLINYAVNPSFLIDKKTAPLIGGAVVAVIANFVLALSLPNMGDASSIALAQSLAVLAACTVLCALALFYGAKSPSGRDLLVAVVGTSVMVAAVYPLRAWTPSISTLVTQVLLGLAVFAPFVAIFDLAGLRTMAEELAHKLMRRI